MPVQRGNNQVFPAIADADGMELCVCTTEQIRDEMISLLNCEPPATGLPGRIVDIGRNPQFVPATCDEKGRPIVK